MLRVFIRRSMGEYILQAQDLTKTYSIGDGEESVVKGVSLDVGTGEFVVIVGSSGSGKTTLLSINTSYARRRFVRVLFVCLLLSLGGCDSEDKKGQMVQKTTESSPAAQAEGRSGTIVALGDSLTVGLGVDEDDAFPARLERRLQAEGHNFRVINAGVSGETTSGTSLAWSGYSP